MSGLPRVSLILLAALTTTTACAPKAAPPAPPTSNQIRLEAPITPVKFTPRRWRWGAVRSDSSREVQDCGIHDPMHTWSEPAIPPIPMPLAPTSVNSTVPIPNGC